MVVSIKKLILVNVCRYWNNMLSDGKHPKLPLCTNLV